MSLRAITLITWLGLFGCSVQSHSGDRSGALRGPEGGAGGRQPLATQPYDDGKGDVWIVDAAVPDDRRPPPLASDAGEPADPDAAIVEPPPEDTFCPLVPAEWLAPGNAGDGATSGCAPKVCQGVLLPTGEELYRKNEPTLPPDGPEPYEDCTQIEGDLLISNYQGTDLSELSCLEYVNGSVLIWYSDGLTSLKGLDSLQYVSGDFRIGYAENFQYENNYLTSIAALSELRAVGGSLVVHGTKLESLVGLESVRGVGGDVRLAIPWAMRDLRGLSGLERIGGDLDLWRYEGPTTLEGLDSLRSIGRNFYLINSDKLIESPGALPNVTCIGGSLDFSGYGDWAPNQSLTHADFLPQLERVGGDVTVNTQHELRTFSILQNVTHIGGSLIAHQNPLLTTLPLPALQHIKSIDVTDNPLLEGCPLLDLGTALGAAPTRFANNADSCVHDY